MHLKKPVSYAFMKTMSHIRQRFMKRHPRFEVRTTQSSTKDNKKLHKENAENVNHVSEIWRRDYTVHETPNLN